MMLLKIITSGLLDRCIFDVVVFVCWNIDGTGNYQHMYKGWVAFFLACWSPMGGIVVIWTDVIFCNRTVYISI